MTLSLLSTAIYGQEYFSPFSRYGVGELRNSTFVRHQALGGISVSKTDSLFNGIALGNPATFGKVQKFSIETGLYDKLYQTRNTLSDTFRSQELGISYLTVAFPLMTKKEWGLSFGIMPYAKSAYTLERKESNATLPNTQFYTANGSLNKVYIGTGIKVLTGIHAGINFNYLFGNEEYQQIQAYDDGTLATLVKQRNTFISGGFFEGGLYSEHRLRGKKDKLSLGLTVAPQKDIKGFQDDLTFVYYPSYTGALSYSDTIKNQKEKKGVLNHPQIIKVGGTYTINSKLSICGEYQMFGWKNKLNQGRNDSLNDAKTIAFGVEYLPSGGIELISTKYLKRVSYRVGFNQKALYYTINGQQPTTNTFSAGFGFPLRKGYSGLRLDVALEAGKIGNLNQIGLEENFFRISLGFKFFDNQWFNPRKED